MTELDDLAAGGDRWREHYEQLCKEGERLGLTGEDLGVHIRQSMTAPELRQMLREWHRASGADPTTKETA